MVENLEYAGLRMRHNTCEPKHLTGATMCSPE